jgi:hypothetical protein
MAVTDPKTFLHEFEGGAPSLELPAVQGIVEGLLGGPETHIAIDIAVTPPTIGDELIRVVEQTVGRDHLELNLTVDLSIKLAEPEVLSFSWGSTNPETPVAVSQEAVAAKPDLDLVGDTFVFSNQAVTIEGHLAIDVPQETVTVESVALTTPQETTIELGIQDVVVPPPIVEHFDLI